jgi:hypothetical protein
MYGEIQTEDLTDLQKTYQSLLRDIDDHGIAVGKRYSLYNVSMWSRNPKHNLVLDPRYSKFEWLMQESYDRMNAVFGEATVMAPETDKYSYLPPLKAQWSQLTIAMRHEKIIPFTITIWDPRNLETRILPCTIAYTFYTVGNQLRCTVYQRACDLINYFISDYFCHCNLFILLAEYMKRDIGKIVWHVDTLFSPRKRKERLAGYADRIPQVVAFHEGYSLWPDWEKSLTERACYTQEWAYIARSWYLKEGVRTPQFRFYVSKGDAPRSKEQAERGGASDNAKR